MRTQRLDTSPQAIAVAAELLRRGELVAFPTETVYGLGGHALDQTAVAAIFAAKGRPTSDPLIVHLATAADLPRVAVDIPPLATELATHFWPGPLTLIVPRHPHVPRAVTAGRETVAVRVPSHPVAHALLVAAGVPVAAPSANRFGHTSPTTADHVLADLDGRIAAIIDGGPTPIGIESTVLDCTTNPPTLLRPGGISLEALTAVAGPIQTYHRTTNKSETGFVSPGLLDRHYAPDHELWLFSGPLPDVLHRLRIETETALAAGLRIGLLLPAEDLMLFDDLPVEMESLGPATEPETMAQRLYAALRALDDRHLDRIFTRDLDEAGLGRALRDRLRRAAARVVFVN
ncbi:L-threonylcarbamoyladenylate synthase [Chloroflexus aggregans]|uniref:Threonylcarbamoyl-AMP synthase n=1 Tax=Chloroflexus aggregans (strain MD-66 / DSM 9485) TaxID=326427 RepID=B8G3G2_CHLAD|nr:L-threonylcarbamoyladenylate synthase [Chloroflexus aggregans]ACL23345.1 Sua5/YciO/YrdC/YwlC family protein [Chloroflexus aggregans DSM 9485]